MHIRLKQIKNSLILLTTAFIWGIAFVAQRVGMDYVEPFTFNGIRSIIGGLFLIPCIFILNKINPKREEYKALSTEEKKAKRKKLFAGGVWCGVIICIASNLQQFGVSYTTVGKAGFITALYIVIVPVIGFFLRKKKQSHRMAGRDFGSGWNIFFMYNRKVFLSDGRFSGIFVCIGIFCTYFGDRLLYTTGGRC